MKTCTDCMEVKPLEDFYRNKCKPDGYKSICKSCDNARTHIRRQTQKGKEGNRKAYATWAAKNKEKVLAKSRRRRALENGAYVGYLPSNYYTFVMGYYKVCASCGSTEKPSLDHIIPLAKGGTHSLANFQRLCRSCNSSKGDRQSTDYRTGRRLAWFVPPIDMNDFRPIRIPLG